jgi:hypothetical protein
MPSDRKPSLILPVVAWVNCLIPPASLALAVALESPGGPHSKAPMLAGLVLCGLSLITSIGCLFGVARRPWLIAPAAILGILASVPVGFLMLIGLAGGIMGGFK